MTKNPFQGKICCITGGASGIGLALGKALLAMGASVHLIDKNEEKLAKLQETYQNFEVHIADVTSYTSLARLFNNMVNAVGRIDLLINNAGIGFTGEFADSGLEHWKTTLDLNLNGVYNGCRAIYPLFKNQGYGQIVNISSMAGLIVFPLGFAYASSKFGSYALSRVLRIEGRNDNILVNVVCPGYVESNLMANSPLVGVNKQFFISQIPFPKMTAQKAAKIILNGIRQNKAIIVFPWYAKLLWLLTRLFPTILDKAMARKVLEFREMKTIHPDQEATRTLTSL